jgi:hypothetical protein
MKLITRNGAPDMTDNDPRQYILGRMGLGGHFMLTYNPASAVLWLEISEEKQQYSCQTEANACFQEVLQELEYSRSSLAKNSTLPDDIVEQSVALFKRANFNYMLSEAPGHVCDARCNPFHVESPVYAQ